MKKFSAVLLFVVVAVLFFSVDVQAGEAVSEDDNIMLGEEVKFVILNANPPNGFYEIKSIVFYGNNSSSSQCPTEWTKIKKSVDVIAEEGKNIETAMTFFINNVMCGKELRNKRIIIKEVREIM